MFTIGSAKRFVKHSFTESEKQAVNMRMYISFCNTSTQSEIGFCIWVNQEKNEIGFFIWVNQEQKPPLFL